MATQDNSFPGSGSGNPYIDSLLWGCRWTGGTITYSFGSGRFDGAAISFEWSEAEKASFASAIATYEAVCNIDFEVSTDRATSDIVLWKVEDTYLADRVVGSFEVPDESFGKAYGYFDSEEPFWSDLGPGSLGFYVILHELGHGVGLAHPHDGGSEADLTIFPGVNSPEDVGTYGLNQGIWTVMSYTSDWSTGEPSTTDSYGRSITPMAFDIAALQYIYGVNASYRTGADTYALPSANVSGTGWSCIWDARGNDTISAAAAGIGSHIDLRAAPLIGPKAAGFVSWTPGIQGGFTIANGAVIENAIGSVFDDTIIGNGVANRLEGGGGIDTMIGGAGDDTFVTDGDDTIVEAARAGYDTVLSSVTLTLGSNLEKLVLTGTGAISGTGNSLANTLTGNSAANLLDGGLGRDRLFGGEGNDTYITDGGDRIIDSGGTDTVRSSATITIGESIERLVLTGVSQINGTGNTLANTITGNEADNVIDGLGGSDRLIGGLGQDVFVFSTTPGSGNVDRIIDYNVVADTIHLLGTVFTEIGAGAVSDTEFQASLSGKAATPFERILYDIDNGRLYFDSDGTGAAVEVLFAIVDPGLNLTSADFIVV